jgi:uncharacterized HAD superfamily protein
MEEEKAQKGDTGFKKFDDGKVMFQLIPPKAIKRVADVFTHGSHKYGKFNFRNRGEWSRYIGAIHRHLNAFEDCIDFDKDAKDVGVDLYHIAQVACNALILLDAYDNNPAGDDRWKTKYSQNLRIGLDIDQVIADFMTAYCERFNVDSNTVYWNFSYDILKNLEAVKDDKDFWLSIPKMRDIHFEPVMYCTSRICDSSITQEWIEKMKLPTAPVVTVGHNQSKVEVLKQWNLDVFIDDSYVNFKEINASGVCACYLMDTPQNTRYDVGSRRLFNLDGF